MIIDWVIKTVADLDIKLNTDAETQCEKSIMVI